MLTPYSRVPHHRVKIQERVELFERFILACKSWQEELRQEILKYSLELGEQAKGEKSRDGCSELSKSLMCDSSYNAFSIRQVDWRDKDEQIQFMLKFGYTGIYSISKLLSQGECEGMRATFEKLRPEVKRYTDCFGLTYSSHKEDTAGGQVWQGVDFKLASVLFSRLSASAIFEIDEFVSEGAKEQSSLLQESKQCIYVNGAVDFYKLLSWEKITVSPYFTISRVKGAGAIGGGVQGEIVQHDEKTKVPLALSGWEEVAIMQINIDSLGSFSNHFFLQTNVSSWGYSNSIYNKNKNNTSTIVELDELHSEIENKVKPDQWQEKGLRVGVPPGSALFFNPLLPYTQRSSDKTDRIILTTAIIKQK